MLFIFGLSANEALSFDTNVTLKNDKDKLLVRERQTFAKDTFKGLNKSECCNLSWMENPDLKNKTKDGESGFEEQNKTRLFSK